MALLFLAGGICLSLTLGPSSSGAPASHTGAPGESTCAKSGCHDDKAINTGTAKVKIDPGTTGPYAPGKTYTLSVSITDAGSKRFGFQLTALDSLNAKAGKIKISDAESTQMLHNTFMLQDREYATYTFGGTGADSPGKKTWKLQWKAPASGTGPVTLYAAFVSANDDETDKGDHVYLHSIKLEELK
ncbi:MAG: hypothetical protein JNL57_14090 [Bacteroidetes bacterium]|nr:hypothetical protein [Bacteroidota bacterium]